jgi:tRNA G18 (ribose-2'-O)-methylase SpoU
VPWVRIGKEASNAIYTAEVDGYNMELVLEFLKQERQNKFQKIIAIEQDETAVDYKRVADQIKDNFIKSAEGSEMTLEYLIILGREVEGVDPKILGYADQVAEIPQYGKKESLNVFSAASIALYRLFDI